MKKGYISSKRIIKKETEKEMKWVISDIARLVIYRKQYTVKLRYDPDTPVNRIENSNFFSCSFIFW